MADKRYKILLAGESWVTTATHIKGFDQFPTVTFHLGAEPLVEALKGSAVRPALHAGARGAARLPPDARGPRRL